MSREEEARFREAMRAMGGAICPPHVEDRGAWADGFVEGTAAMLGTITAELSTAKEAAEGKEKKGAPAPASWKCAACGCTCEASCVDGAGECEEVGDVCSVCDRAKALALKICRAKTTASALVKALCVKQKGKDAPETLDAPRVEGVIDYLERTGAIARTVEKKLLASQPTPA